MNKNHTLVATLTSVAASLIAAYAPAIRALAGAHPYVTGSVAAILAALLGVLPSATGTDTPKES